MKEIIIEKLYKIVKVPYEYFFKNQKAWDVTISDFINLPEESLGFHLGCFLLKYNLEPQPRLEEHDIYHVLTNTGVLVTDEINMQFYLLGNGKKTPFVFMVIATGLVFYPFRIKTYLESYRKGKQARQFYHLDFLKMLPVPLANIKSTFNIK
jgi:ubiquinone biosynthesis protein Coq4